MMKKIEGKQIEPHSTSYTFYSRTYSDNRTLACRKHPGVTVGELPERDYPTLNTSLDARLYVSYRRSVSVKSLLSHTS